MNNMLKKNTLSDGIKYITLFFGAFTVLLPPYIIFIAAFKTKLEFARSLPFSFPENILNMQNFLIVFEKGHIGLGLYNISFILALTIIGNVILGTMAAYALGRFDFKLKKLILGAYALSIIIPTVTTQVTKFSIIKNLHLMNTHFSVILLYLGTDVIQLYIYLQFIKSIPYELDESAFVEGASLFKIYYAIILPLTTPATVTAIILKTIIIYNDMYTPYLYMTTPKLMVISTALMRFKSSVTTDWNTLSAAAVVVMIPTIVLYLFLQRYIIDGVVSGAVKG